MEEQEIRSRMLSYAAKAWGFSDAAIENSFDPLVSLLLGASAHEIGKVYNEISSTENRLLLKLTQLLTPDVITGAAPAHAICHASPVDEKAITDVFQHLYFQRKSEAVFGREDFEDVFFTPAGKFPLVNSEVTMQASGNKLFAYKTALSKETAGTSNEGAIAPNKLWIGFETTDDWKDIHHLNLFFESRNPAESISFYHDLASASVYCNGVKLKVQSGIEDKRANLNGAHQKLITTKYSITAQTEEHVLAYYSRQFLTIQLPAELKFDSETLPADHPEVIFSPLAFQKVQKKLLWLSVEIPGKSKNYNLSEVVCALNCFPVINRCKEEFTYRLSSKHTIIALQSPGRFLDMVDVSTQDNVPFFETAISNPSQAEAGSYLLRHSGAGRFDKRNAQEMTEYLLQLLRDESASFSALGKEMIESQMKQLNQIIASIEQRVDAVKKTGENAVSYLIVNALRFPENIFVQYWRTHAAKANQIRPGTKLSAHQGNPFHNDSVFLMTTTTGGRNALSPSESVRAYKNAVLSRQRIVTHKDIETAALMIAGEQISSVNVEKGVTTEPGSTVSYVRCVNVAVKFKSNIPEEERSLLCREVQTYLENHSNGMYPFVVSAA